MKKFLLITVMMIATLVLIAGCGRNNDDGQPHGGTANQPPTEISIWFMGGNATDDSDVIVAANARLLELGVNVAINPIWTGGWAMGEPAQMALDTSVDIVWAGSWGLNFWTNARRGNFRRLDDPNNNLLARYGQDMMRIVPDTLWGGFTMDGPQGFGVYGIPGYKDYAQMYVWDVNNTLLSQLGFNFDDMFDMDGLNYDVIFDPMFVDAMQAAKDLMGPTFFPLAHEGGNWARFFSHMDMDITGVDVFHFAFDPYNPAEPRGHFPTITVETPEYVRILERLHYFYQRGFIDPRTSIPGQAVDAFIAQTNAAGIGTNFLGFTFNDENVLIERAAIASVTNEFMQVLQSGVADPAITIPIYLNALRANGLDRIQAELNRQLQEFYAAR